jgi:2-C-methyl-D-erythritol 2,4-cyclodiphosphate synthase
MDYRVGIGYDIHRLVKGRALVLGGITIPFSKGLKGHSDADVLVHALCDALLGAVNAGDIGEHFSDQDPRYRNIASMTLLKKVVSLLRRKGYKAHNIDAIVILQEPKLLRYKDAMRSALGSCLGIKTERVSVKAKTNEGLDAVGRGNAVACYCAATVIKR